MPGLAHDFSDLKTHKIDACAAKGDINFPRGPPSPGSGRSSMCDPLTSRQRHVSRSRASDPIGILVPYSSA